MQDILDKILIALPDGRADPRPDNMRVMTVRMPATLHAALTAEARQRGTSANKLCIAKLQIKSSFLDKATQKAETDASKVRGSGFLREGEED